MRERTPFSSGRLVECSSGRTSSMFDLYDLSDDERLLVENQRDARLGG
jgi:hypothetical protein